MSTQNATQTAAPAQQMPADPLSQHLPAAAPRQDIGQVLIDAQAMTAVQQFAQVMAAGRSTVPKHLQGNEADCMAVVLQAMQWRMIPHVVAQKTHIVNGALGYEAQLVNAVICAMSPTKDRVNYEWFGDWKNVNGKTDRSDARGVRVFATMKGEAEPRVLEVTMAEAGVRNSPLWEQAPKIQLAYLATKRWARLHCPDVILGVYTPDELLEFQPPAPKSVRQMGPAEVVAKQAEQAVAENGDYAAYEANALPFLRDASVDGMDALKAARAQLPSCEFKARLWELHGDALKTAATIADEAAAEAGATTEQAAAGDQGGES